MSEFIDAPMPFPNDSRLAETEVQIQQWIQACNHEPARRVLRRYLGMIELKDCSFALQRCGNLYGALSSGGEQAW